MAPQSALRSGFAAALVGHPSNNCGGAQGRGTLAGERVGARIARASPEELAQVIEGFSEIVGD